MATLRCSVNVKLGRNSPLAGDSRNCWLSWQSQSGPGPSYGPILTG